MKLFRVAWLTLLFQGFFALTYNITTQWLPIKLNTTCALLHDMIANDCRKKLAGVMSDGDKVKVKRS